MKNMFIIFAALVVASLFSSTLMSATVSMLDSVVVGVGELVELPEIVIVPEAIGEMYSGAGVWICLPDGFRFDESVRSMRVSSDKVAGIASFAYNGSALFVPIMDDLDPGEAFTVSGLPIFSDFASGAAVVSLDVDGDGESDSVTSGTVESVVSAE